MTKQVIEFNQLIDGVFIHKVTHYPLNAGLGHCALGSKGLRKTTAWGGDHNQAIKAVIEKLNAAKKEKKNARNRFSRKV